MKANYLISCAIVALLSATAAGGSAFAAGPSDAATPAATDNTDSSTVGEIIVSAERRDQRVEDVPATIQAFSGQNLQEMNVTTVDSLLKITPNVTFGNNGPGQGSIFMRGLSAGFAGSQSSATVANFPNVAVYLDDQSMQFPARNIDIYMADMQRVEVLEGPQGTLFGGGAEAGAVRYITNKPKFNVYEGSAEASYGGTSGGADNDSVTATFNIPLIEDKLAVRATFYNDRHGGYIDNVPSTFTRANTDIGNYYFNIHPVAGLCPNGQAPGSAGQCTLPNAPQANNFAIAAKDFNPVTYTGARFSVLFAPAPDWDILIAQSFQSLDAQGLSVEYPVGSDFQTLKPLQVTSFAPSYEKDRYENTAWTVNGKFGDLKAVYTGGYMERHISQQMDYTNYSRTGGGISYQCTGDTGASSDLFGGGPATCFSPVGYWQDTVRNTHLSNEFRLSTPDDWRLRGIVGAYYEQFRIYDVMNFNYKTIPSCSPANLSVALGGGQPCVADVRTAPNSTANNPGIRSDSTAFGEDTQRGYDQTAFFGSFDYDIIPKVLTFTAGTRWYQYDEFETGSQYGTGSGCVNVPNGQCTGGQVNIDNAHDKVRYSGFKSRANITWHIDPNNLVYALFSQGFRPGAFNRSVGAVATGPGANPGDPNAAQYEKPNGYAPDSLDNYEVGLKSELLDHRLQINLSAYYMEWKNVQFLFFNPTELGNTTFGVNGPNYEVKGAEAQFIARLGTGLTVQGSATYNQDTQQNSPCLVGNIAGTASFGKCITQIIPSGQTVPVPFVNPFGAPGAVPAFSPKFQGNLRARYDWDVKEYHPFVMASVSYTGKEFNQPATYESGAGVVIPDTTYLRYEQPGYTTFDASIGFSKDKYTVTLFGNNLGNSHASTFTSSAQFIKSEVPLRPRTFGLRVGETF
jgi:iron complex outermembrane receptor protein